VVITGRVIVASEEKVGDVVIINDDARVNSSVDGSVFALNGDVIIRGSVRNDVTAMNGRVVVGGGARVGGDVTSRAAQPSSRLPRRVGNPVGRGRDSGRQRHRIDRRHRVRARHAERARISPGRPSTAT